MLINRSGDPDEPFACVRCDSHMVEFVDVEGYESGHFVWCKCGAYSNTQAQVWDWKLQNILDEE